MPLHMRFLGTLALATALVSTSVAGPRIASMHSGPKNEVVPGRLLVRVTPSMARSLAKLRRLEVYSAARANSNQDTGQLDQWERNIGGSFLRALGDTGWTLWRMPQVADVKWAAQRARNLAGVSASQPLNRIYPLLTEPNDPDWNAIETGPPMVLDLLDEGNAYFRRMWHIDDTATWWAWNDFPNKWYTAATKVAERMTSPLIAVIDTGLDMDHPDYANAGNPSTDAASGGQIEHSLSRQFQDGEVLAGGDPSDENGHGTHVAGIAIAAGNNGSFNGHGTIGIGYNSRAMILRVFDSANYGSDMDAAVAIMYAADSGANIINLSLGTTNYSQIFQDAVTYAWQKGCLIIAAGNEDGGGGGNLGPIYPAACSGALAVTANGPYWTPANDNYAGYGSYVDVAAPGGNLVTYSQFEFALQYIWSTSSRFPCSLSENPAIYPPYTLEYSYLIGTSMACPVVSGAAGLFWDKFNLRPTHWDNVRAYRAIERSAQATNGLTNGGWELTQGYGSLDTESLVKELDTRSARVGGAEGIVYYGGTPLANVRVQAQRVGSTARPMQTTTRPDGGYRFDGLLPGVWSVTASPFGARKTKRVRVISGSDISGTDFWCGPAWWDETNPVIADCAMTTWNANSASFRLWAYDPETSIESVKVRVGTWSGGADLMADVDVPVGDSTFSVSGFNLTPGIPGYLTVTVTNGENRVTRRTFEAILPTPLAAMFTSFTAPASVAPGQSFNVSFTVRNIGTTSWVNSPGETYAVSTNSPFENTTFGVSRVNFPNGVTVANNQTRSFTVACTAPSRRGKYVLQWRMRATPSAPTGFGLPSANAVITVN